MKRYVYVGIIAALVFCTSALIANAQADEETLLKTDPQAQAVVDTQTYVIGAEDVLYIHVWKEDALSKTLPVRMDGNISLPLIHQVKAAGLTPPQLEEVLIRRLKEFYEAPNVSVTVMEANSYKVYISGQVKTPGVYKLRSEMTILQVVPMAGGFTEWAKQTKILVIRKENDKENRLTVNYKKALKGVPGSNLVLRPGDNIIVP